MEVQWRDHTLKVTGDWTLRWLYLAPQYELWLDDQKLDSRGGPRLKPLLEAIYEDEEGELHHIEAELVSVIGYRPYCEIKVEGEVIAADKVRVENFINPFLMLVIMASTVVMLYLGPEVIRDLLGI
ncbi:hypothetical protein DL240_14840 [Lujinxingia litoralis]|uniref:Uncharacterized protein n=1 Tax=Lujinxingia litoralis TaxID=2211119 RepID=A0A328C2L3_9DELT|nr:hypothetical protein [Lujinxingia litoralis]RAL20947.1 hypothetical protein DL240_14840 [Lujinxingia litoralis]